MLKYNIHGTTWNVYETNTEAVTYLTKYHKKFCDAQPGDYVLTLNGYFVPIIDRHTRKFKSKLGMRDVVILTHPTGKWSLLGDSKRTFKFEVRAGSGKAFLSKREQAVIDLVATGVSLPKAIEIIVGGKQNLRKIYYFKLLNTPIFLKKLGDKVMEMTEALKAQGINEGAIAEEIAELIKDRKANATLRKFAIEYATEVLKAQKQANGKPASVFSLQSEINNEMRIAK